MLFRLSPKNPFSAGTTHRVSKKHSKSTPKKTRFFAHTPNHAVVCCIIALTRAMQTVRQCSAPCFHKLQSSRGSEGWMRIFARRSTTKWEASLVSGSDSSLSKKNGASENCNRKDDLGVCSLLYCSLFLFLASYHIFFKSCQCEKNNCCLLFCRWSSCEIKSSLASSCWLQFVEAWCWTLSNGCLARVSARMQHTTAWLGVCSKKSVFFGVDFECFLETLWVVPAENGFFGESRKSISKNTHRGREKKCPRYPFFSTAPPLG